MNSKNHNDKGMDSYAVLDTVTKESQLSRHTEDEEDRYDYACPKCYKLYDDADYEHQTCTPCGYQNAV